MVARGFDGGFDDFAVGFGGEGDGAAGAAGSCCASYPMQVDLVRLRCFVVDDDVDAFDVEPT